MAVVKIKPALYIIEGQPWAWVHLSEVAEILGIKAKDVWERFFLLSKDVDVLGICDGAEFWNIGEEGEIAQSFDGERWRYAFGSKENFKRKLQGGDFYVPAGWVLDVIRAWEAGTDKVVFGYHEHRDELDECPKGTLKCSFQGGPFWVAAVGIDADGNPVDPDRHHQRW